VQAELQFSGATMLKSWGLAAAVSALAVSTWAQPVSAPVTPPSTVWSIPDDAEIRRILIDRIDVRRQGVGIVVGVIDAHGRRVVSYGDASKGSPRPLNGDTVFEIGSITKVFTSLVLSDMAQRGEVSLDDPIAKYLPAGMALPRRGDRNITLVDLATQSSGLPRMPTNFAPKDTNNPYADYTKDQLYAFLGTYVLPRDIGSQYEYSNVGVALLGDVLARRAGVDYETLVKQRIMGPLGMESTSIKLSPQMAARLATGYTPDLQPTANWDLPTFAGAGGLHSSANDLLTFLAAELGYEPRPLSAAMKAQLGLRRPTTISNTQIALGWHITTRPDGEVVWHNGGTGGYRTFMGFDPRARIGVVVLTNVGNEVGGDDIARHLLTGAPLAVWAPPSEHTAIDLDETTLGRLVGRYELTPAVIIDVTLVGRQLFAQLTGQQKFEVFPETKTRIFWRVVDAQADFAVGPDGRATMLTLHQHGRDMPARRVDPN
jgi:CubicO group peptidase (beta-lactamase class C family)